MFDVFISVFSLSHFSMNDEFDSDDEQEKGAGTVLILLSLSQNIMDNSSISSCSHRL